MKKVSTVLSYFLVAILASFITMMSSEEKPDSKLDALEQLISDRFIGEVDQTAIEDAAAEAMVAALGDRWSYYIPADEYASYLERMNNAYVGIGVTISATKDSKGYEVTKVTKDGPAEEAGVIAGDIIVALEGQNCAGMEIEACQGLVRGEEGTQLNLTVLRGEEEIPLTVTRKHIETPVAEHQLLENGIGLIRIYNFDSRCADETISAIEELQKQGATSLIFDVRFNPGGYKHELVKVLDYLLPEGPLFRSEDYTGKVVVDESDANCLKIPMAVMVNGDSYSAAEFFAAALSEYDAAVVVGQQTSGKGYFQSAFELPDGSAVGLSIGKYTTPKDVNLAGVGITPDVVVEVDEETAFGIYAGTLNPTEDPQIAAAIDALTK